jgi:leucyl-tRNA synthetase
LPLALAPFAPHIAEELWHRMGHEGSVHLERWIDYDPAALKLAEVEMVVQVNGRVRGRIKAAAGIGESAAVALALEDRNVQAHLEGKAIRKQIFVPDKLLNLVV